MIRSMTGFARVDAEAAGATLRWELRSVNHRYLDVQLRLPDSLRKIEQDCRSIVGELIKRGKVDATLSISMERASGQNAQLDIDAARQIITRAETLAEAMSNASALDPLAILRWPGVLVEDQSNDQDALIEPVQAALRQAAAALSDARSREGSKIHDMLDSRCEEVLQQVAAVRSRLPEVLAEIRQRLADRVQALQVNTDPERLEQEIVLLAQKMDVSEELDRLGAHVSEVRTALDQPEPVGRRLDFLMQELNREANTLGSKSADADTTRHAVDLKVIIEQMREQIQNVE